MSIPRERPMRSQFKACIVLSLLCLLPAVSWAQAPSGIQPPIVQPAPGRQPLPQPPRQQPIQQPAQQQPQQPQEYAFRPDLTNPQFGECLNLEKNWKALWQRYAQEYQRFRMMNPSDSQYQQMAYYLQGLKQQLDAAWNSFSEQCVYFPRRK
jgi:hypothetical protein